MKDLSLCLGVCLGLLAIGIFIGYNVHPTCSWDIMDDPRACYIYFDDGKVAYKSKTTYIGELKSGQSKKFYLENDVPFTQKPNVHYDADNIDHGITIQYQNTASNPILYESTIEYDH